MANIELEQRCNALRLDLKVWEKIFAAANGGRKAGRDDIKADAAILQKHKEYNKLRDILSGKAAPSTPSRNGSSRRELRNVDRTPKASKPYASTPMKRKREDSGVAPEVLPSPNQFLSPQGPMFIGPTPQRDGIVLGLFDLLPAETPSKGRSALADVELNVLQTPSKNAGKAESEISLESRVRGEKTPLSTGKRFLLDSFVTPNKRKIGDQGTPISAFKGFSTPAFLRRDNFLMKIDENDESTPRPAPWKRRGLGRSLSARIQSMRQEEEDRLDEEADIMRELEMEAEGLPAPKKIKVPDIIVEDSQVAMPLGPDRDPESGDEEEIEAENVLGPDGKPKKLWKKKGLKRQTKRVIMRPNFSRPKPQSEQPQDDADDDDRIGETQIDTLNRLSDPELSDDDGSDYASDASHSTKKRKMQKPKLEAASTLQSKDSKQDKEGPVKATARKIKASAHANFRRLKIKSKGGNGAPAPRNPITATPPPPPVLQPGITSKSPKSNSRSTFDMAERELQDLLKQLHQSLASKKYQQSTSLLSRAKVALLGLNALIPTESTPPKHLHLARETLELGAVISIRLTDPVSFTRYFQQLQPFYALPENKLPRNDGNSSKITGLYLLLLLSDGDYAGFHTLLETLEVAAAQAGRGLEEDAFIQYPIRLEQALMEGSYDRVWGETKSERVPSEEFALFSDVLIGTIRKEIASCSEKAYPSIPISDAKSLLFLESEGSVVNFAKESGWVVKDGRIYFPQQDDEFQSKDILVTSDQVIENTLGYARELETIV
ncbi:regulatory particle non-ATPase [Kalmusia sp. IMI 367209]|nr:regulatory particle non-ATPase [Kalmusia sp. IMI 367209]